MGVSKTAVMEQGGKRIVMNGDAHVHRQPDANNDVLDVRSQQLILLPDEDVVYTDLPAEVIKGRSRMNGKGMHYNNKTRQLQVSASTDVEIAGSENKPRRQPTAPPTPLTRRNHDRLPDSHCPTTRLLGAVLLMASAVAPALAADPKPAAGASKTAPAEELHHHDPVGYAALRRREKQSVFTGNVNMTRGLMTLTSDNLEMREDAAGNQYGTATANKGKVVTIRQERPENFELIEGKGLRAEYDGTKSTFDLIGRAVVVRYVCGSRLTRFAATGCVTTRKAAPTRPREA